MKSAREFEAQLMELARAGDLDGLCEVTADSAVAEFNVVMRQSGYSAAQTCKDFWTFILDHNSESDLSTPSARVEVDGNTARFWEDDQDTSPALMAWTAEGWVYAAFE